ncbi:Peptidase M20 domain-containing protein 2 [Escovopsis weberi]|uniref:Peptidase M20 domain-containing protein 2 n=1 Tax=Escovopsis weberi TaxID=150374 RepID=A0A0M8MUS7_ESCWE|nr:Peptidase M20 domain-containing protein 2 [Escovopsis weberi]
MDQDQHHHNADGEVDGFVLVSRANALSPQLRQPPASPTTTTTTTATPMTHTPVSPAPQFLADVDAAVDALDEAFWPVNKRIHDHPERGFKEFIAHDALTGFMRAQRGWQVTPSAYGIETAWVAVYDAGRPGPVVSFNAEMDCLPDIGHACGHNLIATASVVAAAATAAVMRQHGVGGKVVLFGTPAEEGGGGKIKLLEAGAYAEHKVDISLISHPGIVPDVALMRTSSYLQFKVEYFGREAHAAANPWLGINALDALIAGYSNAALLRQQLLPSDRIQGRITDGGAAPGIIHAYAAGVFVVRSETQRRLEELKDKVFGCFTAGAIATGARVLITERFGYKNHVPNRPMARSYTGYFNALESPQRIPEDQDLDLILGQTQASTDQGDISHAMPSLSVGFAIEPGPLRQGPHNPEFALAAGTLDAYKRALRVGKGLAGVAMDVLSSQAFLDEVKKDWIDAMK